MIKKSFLNAFALFVAFLTPATQVWAVEVRPNGQLQVQGKYASEATDGIHWQIKSPNNELGIAAVEQTEAGSFVGVFQLGIDPLSDAPVKDSLIANDAYINWRLNTLSAYVGRLPSLEKVMLVDLTDNQMSLEYNGLAVGQSIRSRENNAVRVDVSSQSGLVLSTQWLFDESEGLAWRSGLVVQVPEGSASLTVRRDPGQNIVFGNQIKYLMGESSVAAVLLYDADEMLSWEAVLQLNLQAMVAALSYGWLNDQGGQWALGLTQPFSESVFGFTEVTWLRQSDAWTWSSGVRMQF